MRIVFCIYNFTEHNLPLQPWLTILHVAEGLVRRGHAVHVISDTDNPATINGVEIHSVDSLRGSNSNVITDLIHSLKPDALVFLPTPLNIATASWLDKIKCRRIGFASYSFYNAFELFTAARCIGFSDTSQYLRHLFVPNFIWKRLLANRYDALIAQSMSTTQRLNSTIGTKIECHYIPPGITLDDWKPALTTPTNKTEKIKLLYMGAATPIRGFNLALKALKKTQHSNIKLRVLARGADDLAIDTIKRAAVKYGISNSIEVVGGWIDRIQLKQEISQADAVLQPFVIVPSEFPVTALEVIACGTPVIGSNINGLPSTIGPAGTVVKHGSATALAEAISRFANSDHIRSDWKNGCYIQRKEMIDWETMVDRWEAVLSGS